MAGLPAPAWFVASRLELGSASHRERVRSGASSVAEERGWPALKNNRRGLVRITAEWRGLAWNGADRWKTEDGRQETEGGRRRAERPRTGRRGDGELVVTTAYQWLPAVTTGYRPWVQSVKRGDAE